MKVRYVNVSLYYYCVFGEFKLDVFTSIIVIGFNLPASLSPFVPCRDNLRLNSGGLLVSCNLISNELVEPANCGNCTKIFYSSYLLIRRK